MNAAAPETKSETQSQSQSETQSETVVVNSADHGQRDAASLKMLGFFFAVLGTLVLVGMFWSRDNVPAIIVNLASGGVLIAIGVGMLVLSRRSRPPQTESPTELPPRHG